MPYAEVGTTTRLGKGAEIMSAEYAVPCKVCGGYYPGDCFRDGCKDPICSCDGCNIHFKRDDECKCSPIEVCDACLLQEGHWADRDSKSTE